MRVTAWSLTPRIGRPQREYASYRGRQERQGGCCPTAPREGCVLYPLIASMFLAQTIILSPISFSGADPTNASSQGLPEQYTTDPYIHMVRLIISLLRSGGGKDTSFTGTGIRSSTARRHE